MLDPPRLRQPRDYTTTTTYRGSGAVLLSLIVRAAAISLSSAVSVPDPSVFTPQVPRLSLLAARAHRELELLAPQASQVQVSTLAARVGTSSPPPQAWPCVAYLFGLTPPNGYGLRDYLYQYAVPATSPLILHALCNRCPRCCGSLAAHTESHVTLSLCSVPGCAGRCRTGCVAGAEPGRGGTRVS